MFNFRNMQVCWMISNIRHQCEWNITNPNTKLCINSQRHYSLFSQDNCAFANAGWMSVITYVCPCYIRHIQGTSVVIIRKSVYMEKYINNDDNRAEEKNNENLEQGK